MSESVTGFFVDLDKRLLNDAKVGAVVTLSKGHRIKKASANCMCSRCRFDLVDCTNVDCSPELYFKEVPNE